MIGIASTSPELVPFRAATFPFASTMFGRLLTVRSSLLFLFRILIVVSPNVVLESDIFLLIRTLPFAFTVELSRVAGVMRGDKEERDDVDDPIRSTPEFKSLAFEYIPGGGTRTFLSLESLGNLRVSNAIAAFLIAFVLS